jgi:hypothetical protein
MNSVQYNLWYWGLNPKYHARQVLYHCAMPQRVFFETGSHCVAQAGLELVILLL